MVMPHAFGLGRTKVDIAEHFLLVIGFMKTKPVRSMIGNGCHVAATTHSVIEDRRHVAIFINKL